MEHPDHRSLMHYLAFHEVEPVEVNLVCGTGSRPVPVRTGGSGANGTGLEGGGTGMGRNGLRGQVDSDAGGRHGRALRIRRHRSVPDRDRPGDRRGALAPSGQRDGVLP